MIWRVYEPHMIGEGDVAVEPVAEFRAEEREKVMEYLAAHPYAQAYEEDDFADTETDPASLPF